MQKDKKVKQEKSKDIRARQWLFTLNNPTMSLEEIHNLTKAHYTTGQLERGVETGTFHMQYMQCFDEQKRLPYFKKLIPQAHCVPVTRDNGVGNYVNKEETRQAGPWTYGQPLFKRNSKTDWDQVWSNAKSGNLDAIPSDVKVRCYSNLKKIEKDHLVYRSDCGRLRGVWIWGESGNGKSRMCKRDYPDAYPKLCNKWWDGYQGQENVVMEDIGLEHKCLGYHLKIWADRYGTTLEVKQGAISDRYMNFVVTSQYSIETIWCGDPETIKALKRRFKVIHLPFKLDFDYNGRGEELKVQERDIGGLEEEKEDTKSLRSYFVPEEIDPDSLFTDLPLREDLL